MLLIHGDNERFDDLPQKPDMTKKRLLLGGAALFFASTVELACGAPVASMTAPELLASMVLLTASEAK